LVQRTLFKRTKYFKLPLILRNIDGKPLMPGKQDLPPPHTGAAEPAALLSNQEKRLNWKEYCIIY